MPQGLYPLTNILLLFVIPVLSYLTTIASSCTSLSNAIPVVTISLCTAFDLAGINYDIGFRAHSACAHICLFHLGEHTPLPICPNIRQMFMQQTLAYRAAMLWSAIPRARYIFSFNEACPLLAYCNTQRNCEFQRENSKEVGWHLLSCKSCLSLKLGHRLQPISPSVYHPVLRTVH